MRQNQKKILKKIKCIFILFVRFFYVLVIYTYVYIIPCVVFFCYFLPDCLPAACMPFVDMVDYVYECVCCRAMHEEWLKIITKLSFRIVDSYNDFIYISLSRVVVGILYCLMG